MFHCALPTVDLDLVHHLDMCFSSLCYLCSFVYVPFFTFFLSWFLGGLLRWCVVLYLALSGFCVAAMRQCFPSGNLVPALVSLCTRHARASWQCEERAFRGASASERREMRVRQRSVLVKISEKMQCFGFKKSV